MFCEDCPLRARCKKPCAVVESVLPKDSTARFERAYRIGALRFLLQLDEKRREVREMLDYRTQLRGRMRRCFEMKYISGLTQRAIARKLGIHRRVVATYLKRAYALIGKWMSGNKRRK